MRESEQRAVAPVVPLEVVAAITAVLSVLMEPGGFAIRGIEPLAVAPAPSAWGRAGILEQHWTRQEIRLWGRRGG